MANDTTKPPEPKKESEPEKKHNSLLGQLTTLLKSPDLQKGIKDVSSLITGKGPTEAQQILDDLKAKDAERLKKIADLQAQIKANEAKIAANNDLLKKSREAVAQAEEARKKLDQQIKELDGQIGTLKKKLAADDDAIAEADKKAAESEKKNAELKEKLGF